MNMEISNNSKYQITISNCHAVLDSITLYSEISGFTFCQKAGFLNRSTHCFPQSFKDSATLTHDSPAVGSLFAPTSQCNILY